MYTRRGTQLLALNIAPSHDTIVISASAMSIKGVAARVPNRRRRAVSGCSSSPVNELSTFCSPARESRGSCGSQNPGASEDTFPSGTQHASNRPAIVARLARLFRPPLPPSRSGLLLALRVARTSCRIPRSFASSEASTATFRFPRTNVLTRCVAP